MSRTKGLQQEGTRLTEWPIRTLRTDRHAQTVLQLQGPDAPFQVHACLKAPVSTAGTCTSGEGMSWWQHGST